MNFKTTAFLIILLAILGAFVYFTRDHSPSYQELQQAKQAALQGQRLIDDAFDPQAIEQVVIEQDGYKAVLSRTDDGQWEQTRPVNFPLSQASVQAMLNTIADTRYTEKLDDAATARAKEYGLEDGATVVTLLGGPENDAAGSAEGAGRQPVATIELGRATIGSRMYARLEGGAICVIPDSLSKQLEDRPWQRWRVRSLIAPQARQVNHVALTHHVGRVEGQDGEAALSLAREDGQWRFEQPDGGRADAQKVAGILTNLATTTIDRFIADAPKDLAIYGLDQPRLTLQVDSSKSVSTGNAATQPSIEPMHHTLCVGSQSELDGSHYYATWTHSQQAPVVFTISSEALEKLALHADALRDPHLVPVTAGQVRQLSLEHDGHRLAFSRSASGWTFDDQGIGFASDDAVVADLVSDLVRTGATRYLPASAVREKKPLAVVTMTELARAKPYTLRIWQANEKDEKGGLQWVALLDDEPVARVFAAGRLEAVTQPTWYFRSRDIASVDKAAIDHVILTRRGQTHELTRQVPGEGSKIDQPTPWQAVKQESEGSRKDAPQPLGQTEVNGVLDQVTVLRAKAWLPPQQAELGTADELVTLTLKAGDATKLTLTMNPQGHAKLAEGEQLFVVRDALRDALLGPTQTPGEAKTAE